MIVSENNFLLLTSLSTLQTNFFDNFSNYEAFHIVSNLKLEQLSCKRVPNFVVVDNYFTDLFTEVQRQYRKTINFGRDVFLKDKVNYSQNVTVFNNFSC